MAASDAELKVARDAKEEAASEKAQDQQSSDQRHHGGATPKPKAGRPLAAFQGRKKKQRISSGTTNPEVRDNKLYQKLSTYLLSEYQMEQSYYPRPVPGKPGSATILTLPHLQEDKARATASSRLCRRCRKSFDFPYSHQESCRYHWGKFFAKPGSRVKSYNCCGKRNQASPGCETAQWHVQELNIIKDTTGFVQTQPGEVSTVADEAVYVLDCEMIFTKSGLELAKLTVINGERKIVYDTMVKPSHEIIDYHTRFSGIRPEDMAGVTTTPEDVQRKLLSLFTDKTILLGHGLGSDLRAVKLLHGRVVDTAEVFPHQYPNRKMPLTDLALEKLGKRIRVNGHDSREDAECCLDLMKWKITRGF